MMILPFANLCRLFVELPAGKKGGVLLLKKKHCLAYVSEFEDASLLQKLARIIPK